jgi:hypothetical protein
VRGGLGSARRWMIVMAGTVLHRLTWALCLASALAVLGLSRAVTPDPSGMGTHTQLGLAPCGFLYLTRLPCPTCGLTTSFAHMARLSLTDAIAAHWLGPALFALTALAVPLSMWGCVTASSPADAINRLRVGRLAAIIAAAAVVAWMFRIAPLLLS